MVFIFEKFNWGSDFTFQVPSRYRMYGTWSKKIPKVWDQNSDFYLYHPSAPRLDFKITQNLVEDSFLYILYNFEVERTSFDEAGKIIPR